MPHESSGLFVTLPLAGYGIGLLTIVPLGDLFENRRLALALVGAEMLCTLALSLTTQPTVYLGIAFLTGLLASVVQLFVPYVTYLVPKEAQGRAVGRAISGLMLGVMLARPSASIIARFRSWREVVRVSSMLMAALMI